MPVEVPADPAPPTAWAEDPLSDLAAVLPLPVAVVEGGEGWVVAANPAWCRLPAAPGAHADGRRVLADLFPGAVKIALACAEGGTATLRALQLASRAGEAATWWDLDIVAHPRRPGALVVTAREVTEQVLARREARRAGHAVEGVAERLRLPQEAAGLGTWDWDARADRLAWSPEQFRLHGLDPAGDVPPGAAGWLDLVHPEDRHLFEGVLAGRAAEADGHYAIEFRLRRADTGAWRWMLSRARITGHDAEGRPTRIVGVNLDITDRRAAEAAAIAERAEIASAWGSLPVGLMLVATPDGRILRCKPPPGHDFGDTVGGTLAASAAASPRLHLDGSPIALQELPLARALWRGETVRGEVVLRRATDGMLRETLVSATPIRDGTGEVTAAVALVQDVTDDRTTAAALAKTQARLLEALEAGRVMAFEWDTATDAVTRSPTAAAILGLDPSEATSDTGATYFLRVHPEDRDRFRATLGRLTPAEPHYSARYRLHRTDGRTAWVEETGSGVFDVAGGLARVRGLVRDVTAQAEAEVALGESEARLRLFVERAPAAIAMLDAEMRYVAVSRRYLADYGLDAAAGPEALAGRSHYEVFPELPERWRAVHRRVLIGGETLSAEDDPFPRAGGWTDWVRWEMTPWRRADGSVGGALLFSEVVTARMEAQAALRESEERLRLALEAGQAGAWEWDLATGEFRCDASLKRLTGVDFPDGGGAAAAAFFERVHPDDLAPNDAAMREAIARGVGASYRVEFRFRRGDGAWRWFAGLARVLAGSDGRPTRVVGVDYDVTERRETERAVTESRALLAEILEAAADPIFLKDREGRYVLLNEATARVFGRTRDAVAGRADADLVPPDMARRLREVDLEVMRRGIPRVVEEPLDLPGLGPRIFLTSKAPRRAADGSVTGVVGVARDVTERKAAEAALAASEAHFRALADSMPQLAFTATPDGLLDFVNRRWEEYTGQTEDQARGRGAAEALHAEDRARSLAVWAAAVADGCSFEIEHRLQGEDGTYRWFLTRAEPLRDASGRILKWFGTSTDISEIVAAREAVARHAEELERRVAERTRALSEAAAELEAAMRRREAAQAALIQSQKLEALGQVTGSIAHDFNNVLGAVEGGLRLLKRRAETDPTVQQLIDQGIEATGRGARLIGQLMAFARKEEPKPAVLDPLGLLEGALGMVRHTVGRGVECALSAAPGTWSVIADPVRLEMVLLNLAANARDAMPGGGRLEIAARNADAADLPPSLAPGRDWVLISVADTGSGMDAETLRRASEPFFTTKLPGRGTGLGLASADEFARTSGGALRLRSAPGQGTTVELFLPRAAVQPTPVAASRADPRHGGARLLVVDDDPGVRTVVAGMLAELGYEVVQAASAEAAEAAAHAEGGRIDMLVSDVVMEGADGALLAARLRSERPDLPVLFVTGYPGSVDLGDAPVLRKPFTEDALTEAVLQGLGRLPDGAPGT